MHYRCIRRGSQSNLAGPGCGTSQAIRAGTGEWPSRWEPALESCLLTVQHEKSHKNLTVNKKKVSETWNGTAYEYKSFRRWVIGHYSDTFEPTNKLSTKKKTSSTMIYNTLNDRSRGLSKIYRS
jgi:hypothetical protein